MRKNAAMHGGAEDRKPSPTALLPMALVVVAVVVLALVVKGSQRGTIVVERIAFSSSAIQNGRSNPPLSFSITEITQTAADGTVQRSFVSDTIARPEIEQVTAGQNIQVYDPRDNTIFVTTQPAIQRALNARVARTAPKGVHISGSSSSREISVSSRLVFAPGRRSVYAQGLHAHQYRLAGRTTVDGHPALRLTESSRLALQPLAGFEVMHDTAYVSPRTLDPIEAITKSELPGVESTLVERWSVYRVLPATSHNQRLLSLSSLHPHANVVHSAGRYLRATTFTSSSTG